MFKGEDIVDSIFTFEETPPLNSEFELFGIEDLNFMLNSGSYFVVQIGIVIYFSVRKLLNRVAVRNADKKWARKLGQWAFMPSYWKSMKQALLKLLLESYFDICFCTLINVIALSIALKEGHLDKYFGSFSDALCTSITLFYMLVLVLFPAWGAVSIMRNFKKLETSTLKSRFGVSTEDLATTSVNQALFNIIFMARRFLNVAVLVFVDWSFAQCQLLMIFSTASFIYRFTARPYKSQFQNRVELFNELTILLCSHICNQFLDIAIHLDTRDILGWVLIGLAVFNILVNLALIGLRVVMDCWKTR